MHTISVDYLEAQERRANWFSRQNPGLREELDRVNAEIRARGRTDNFYTSLAESLNRYGSLTERQNAALKRSLTQYHDRNAQRAQEAAPIISPIPEGRVLITGVVKSTKWQDNDFGGCLKMLVQSDEGWRVWGTVPAAIDDVKAGDRVTFVAAVTPKEPSFGFFSRPSKALKLDATPAAPVVEVKAPVAAPAPVAGVARPFLASLVNR